MDSNQSYPHLLTVSWHQPDLCLTGSLYQSDIPQVDSSYHSTYLRLVPFINRTTLFLMYLPSHPYNVLHMHRSTLFPARDLAVLVHRSPAN